MNSHRNKAAVPEDHLIPQNKFWVKGTGWTRRRMRLQGRTHSAKCEVIICSVSKDKQIGQKSFRI